MAEIWDLYDEQRRPIGKTIIRGQRIPRGSYHMAVGIWTVNSDNKILVTLRDRSKREWAGYWENTAGSVVSGETSARGAVRELFEETGIRISEDQLTLLGTERTKCAFGDCYIVRIDVPISEIVFQKGETCDAKWVTLEELDEMIKCGVVATPVSARLAKIRHEFEAFLYGGKDDE